MERATVDRSRSGPAGAGLRPRGARAWGLFLAAAALAAHLFLPLVLTCRTYRSLALNQVPACCAGKAACGNPGQGGEVPSLRSDGVRCPYCRAASPFRHASPAPAFVLAVVSAPLRRTAPVVPASAALPPPSLTAASPRAPPAA